MVRNRERLDYLSGMNLGTGALRDHIQSNNRFYGVENKKEARSRRKKEQKAKQVQSENLGSPL
jgi:hypothetical protein